MNDAIRHVVWDWNGTLFADLDAVVAATNVALATATAVSSAGRSAPSTSGCWAGVVAMAGMS